jgi:hypothetical protein
MPTKVSGATRGFCHDSLRFAYCATMDLSILLVLLIIVDLIAGRFIPTGILGVRNVRVFPIA